MIDTNNIFRNLSSEEFLETALNIFRHQYNKSEVYFNWCQLRKKTPENVCTLNDIPFLPIEFFKNNVINCQQKSDAIFTSSGTTGQSRSSHHVADISVYEKSFLSGFELFYGSTVNFCIVGLLPGYLERNDSSLVYMFDKLMKFSGHQANGMYLSDHEKLFELLKTLKHKKQKTILVGVTYALLDFAEKYHISFPELIVMETGGMKGKREEITRQELHTRLKKSFTSSQIHSEYGMTELLSQAYMQDVFFRCPPWMKVLIRDPHDPISYLDAGKTGGINIIDLANINSCSFIETQDLGRLKQDGEFEVLGRIDHSAIRGCNLMIIS